MKKDKKFVWTNECGSAMKELKNKLLTAPILGYSNNRDDFTLTTDASSTEIGAILTLKQNGVDGVIAYASKTLNKSQRKYSETKRENFDVVHLTNHFRTYLLGLKFVIVSDHRALVWLYNFKDPEGMIERLLERLGQFDFEMEHNAGKDIPHANCLLRVQSEEEDTTAFIAALTFEENVQEQLKNPWMLLQNTNSGNIQRKQQEDKKLAKFFSWLKDKQR